METGTAIVIAVAVLVGLWVWGLIRKVTGWLIHGLLLVAVLLLAYSIYTGSFGALR